MYVIECLINKIVCVYGLPALDHRVVRSLNKPCLAFGSVNTGSKNSLNGIEHPVIVNA